MAEPLGGGCSNTPPKTDLGMDRATCVDYWKCRFDISWEKEKLRLRSLLDILHVKQSESYSGRGHNGYSDAVILAPGISIHHGGAFTKNKNGEETCLLEMKGEGCREFEQRYYSALVLSGVDYPRARIVTEAWAELIQECLSMGGHCTRLDMPTDDFSGEITIDEIKEKIRKREYSTRLRRVRQVRSGENEGGVDDIEDEQISQIGYSVTLGGVKHVQLCIYDKLAERTSHGLKPNVSSWIRFEVRYFHENAENAARELLDALLEMRESEYIVGCLSKIMTFTEGNTFGRNDNYRNAIWPKWAALLENAREPESFATSPKELSIERNFGWSLRSIPKTFARMVLALGITPNAMGSLLSVVGIDKLGDEDLMAINQFRKAKGMATFKEVSDLSQELFKADELCLEWNELLTDMTQRALRQKGSQGVRTGASYNEEE